MNHRKKVLFLIGSLSGGGVAKSMINLLHAFDKERYEVSLWIGHSGGLYANMVPEGVKVLISPVRDALFEGLRGIAKLLSMGHPLLACGSLLRMVLSTINKAKAGLLLAKLLPTVEGEYDAIIDYNGQHQLYYMVDKLKGKTKITFFHNDYTQWPYYKEADALYFPQTDAIFSISEVCVNSLKKEFPDCAHKVELMENISNPKFIKKCAKAFPVTHFNKNSFNLVTVGHVCERKGSSLALNTASILKNRNVLFHWYFIGELQNDINYSKLVDDLHLKNEVSFVGAVPNPYPYMSEATLIVHPSQFEGKSIALDEAKLLCKPVVVTNFSTVDDQFEHGVNANICEMTPESLADAIEDLLLHADKRERYSTYLSEHIHDNSSEVQKLYQLVD